MIREVLASDGFDVCTIYTYIGTPTTSSRAGCQTSSATQTNQKSGGRRNNFIPLNGIRNSSCTISFRAPNGTSSVRYLKGRELPQTHANNRYCSCHISLIPFVLIRRYTVLISVWRLSVRRSFVCRDITAKCVVPDSWNNKQMGFRDLPFLDAPCCFFAVSNSIQKILLQRLQYSRIELSVLSNSLIQLFSIFEQQNVVLKDT
jgi:hypothetical protein